MVALVGANMVLPATSSPRVLIRPYELSVSLLLGIIGSLVFILLLWRGGQKGCSLKANIPNSSGFSLSWPSELVSHFLAHHQPVCLCLETCVLKRLSFISVAIATGISTISFQTLTENRFLTPSILGIEPSMSCYRPYY